MRKGRNSLIFSVLHVKYAVGFLRVNPCRASLMAGGVRATYLPPTQLVPAAWPAPLLCKYGLPYRSQNHRHRRSRAEVASLNGPDRRRTVPLIPRWRTCCRASREVSLESILAIRDALLRQDCPNGVGLLDALRVRGRVVRLHQGSR